MCAFLVNKEKGIKTYNKSIVEWCKNVSDTKHMLSFANCWSECHIFLSGLPGLPSGLLKIQRELSLKYEMQS